MEKTKKRFSVLIPDGERRHLESVVYCLSQISGIEIHVMSNKKDDPLRYSRFVSSYTVYPMTENEKQWMSYLNSELEKNNIDILLPVFEERIKTLIKYKKQLKNEKALVALPSLQSFDTANRKELLSRHLKLNNLQGPDSIYIAPGSYGQIKTSSLSFPLLAKPTEMTDSGKGIQLFRNRVELDYFFMQQTNGVSYLLQKFIDGYDLGCNVLCKNGHVLAYTIQKGNLWDNKSPYSPQIGLDFLYEEEVLSIVMKLMKSLNWSGVANVDMLYDEKNNEFHILEVNPRYWSTLDASLIAGVNFPYLQCLTAIGERFEIPSYANVGYLNLKGIMVRLKQDKTLLFKYSFLKKNTTLRYIIRDPMPMAYRLLRRVKKLFLLGK